MYRNTKVVKKEVLEIADTMDLLVQYMKKQDERMTNIERSITNLSRELQDIPFQAF